MPPVTRSRRVAYLEQMNDVQKRINDIERQRSDHRYRYDHGLIKLSEYLKLDNDLIDKSFFWKNIQRHVWHPDCTLHELK